MKVLIKSAIMVYCKSILEGEKAAIEALPQITAIMTQLRQEGKLE
jgi:hypothetical protein